MKKWLILIMLVVFFLAMILKIYHDTNSFTLNYVRFHSEKLPAGSNIRIVQISDLHNKVFGDTNESLVRAIEELDADLIVLTGDLIDTGTDSFDNVYSFVERLTKMNANVFFVSGNHEWENTRYKAFLSGLVACGVRILNNTSTQLTIHGTQLNLVGMDDFATRHENLDEAFRNLDSSYYTVLLAHAPDITKAYSDIPADLILSGHTHGGQVRLPLIGALVAPGQGFFPRLDKGIFQLGSGRSLYIDSGLGTSVLPIRLFNQSQFSLITISND